VQFLSTYRAKVRLVQLLSTLAVLGLPFLNVLRLDIPTLRFYFLNSVLWIDEFYLVFLVLMLVLWGIVFFSMLYGRMWCGWMCPQMTLTVLVRWIESAVGRLVKFKRKSKRRAPLRRAAFHTLVVLGIAGLSLLVGFNLVSYFVDPYRMIREMAQGSLTPLVGHFILGIGIFIVINLTFWREKFCAKACPYGMMQLLVTDSKTQIMRYHTERANDCTDCKACVRCCIMWIDIRTSPYQTECVYCGDCVDACEDILPRLGKPGLINFSWGEKQIRPDWLGKLGFVDAKRWIILALMVVYTAGLVVLVQARQPLAISASGDRSILFREGIDGRITNDYTVRVQNRSLNDGVFEIGCAGPGDLLLDCDENPLALKSRESRLLKLSITTRGAALDSGPNRLILSLRNLDDRLIRIETEIVFFMPQEDPRGLKSR